MNLSTWLMTALGLLLGVGLGVLAHWGWSRRGVEQKLRLPARWLLNARGLMTSEEQEVWKWLRTAFADHAVMIKVPVMRFTIPSTKNRPENKDQHWHELLEGVYCSFSVCTLEGKVVGCVDVPGKRGLPRAQKDMKESLLLECGIGYTTVRSGSLPSGGAMRAAFLGEVPMAEAEAEETRGGDSSFHAALDEFTSEKVRALKAAAMKELNDRQTAGSDSREKSHNVGFNPEGTGSLTTQEKPDRFVVQWEDSFSMPADSRPAKLS